MAGQALDPVSEVWDDWQDAVNMTAKELEDFLGSDESKSVGDKSSGGESTGHASGRRIVEIQRTKKADLTDDDAAHMREVVGYVHRHLAQRPSGDVADTKWRYSLMNWGHDPTKEGPERIGITLAASVAPIEHPPDDQHCCREAEGTPSRPATVSEARSARRGRDGRA
ncbi:MAG: hypothetical protein QOK30_581 [Nocardioidaceae bacterium]|jgi:hypothetical protein|nr:hypothetical protein [Nocardioidaceae bacterium]